MSTADGTVLAELWTLAVPSRDDDLATIRRKLSCLARLADTIRSLVGEFDELFRSADMAQTAFTKVSGFSSEPSSTVTDALGAAMDFFDWAGAALEEATEDALWR